MRRFYIGHRISLAFKTRQAKINYLRKLPIEVRYGIRYSGFPYNWKYVPGIYRNIKYLFSHLGFILSEEHRIKTQWYNLDMAIGDFILPRLRMFRNNLHGWPGNLEPLDRNLKYTDEQAMKDWCSILDDMIYAFEHTYRIQLRKAFFSYCLYDVRRERGMMYFVKYYTNLWD